MDEQRQEYIFFQMEVACAHFKHSGKRGIYVELVSNEHLGATYLETVQMWLQFSFLF